ncbi:polyprotein [Elysia marginata]|uniref:Polyprotein n=1 Tax=Elysia marginata TaxID=1093978 RepID=A0AAV4GIX8_9GAST|nr:polyprotein [Elysia marginata]
MKDVIGQTQVDRKVLVPSSAKWWSKTEGKEKKDMNIDEVKQREDFRRTQKAVQQSQQEWDKHSDVIRRTTLRPDIVIHAPSTQQRIMVELTVPYESRMEQAHTYKKEKYLVLTKELEENGYRAKIMPIEISAREFGGSSAYDPLSKLSISGNKRTKALKLIDSRKEILLDLDQEKRAVVS